MKNTLDSFTRAYIQTALWSSTEYAHGECPCCGKTALLSHYPEPEYDQQAMCSSAGCGTREIANPPPMDDNYSESDLAPETLRQMAEDCTAFQTEHAELLSACGLTMERAGHNFWLNRNGHGAGFWDEGRHGEEGKACDSLSDASKAEGECHLYAGDDGKLYLG